MERYEARFCRNSMMTSFAANQFVEFLWSARSKFLDCLADFIGIKRGHDSAISLDVVRRRVDDSAEMRCDCADIHRPIVKSRTIRGHGLIVDADEPCLRLVGGLAVFVAAACSRTVH